MGVVVMNQAHYPADHPAKHDNEETVASFEMSSLGQLEELFSIGSHEQPGSPLPATAPHNTNYVPFNAVHMELQENAKLPTFNLPVDRTNSSHSRNSILKLAPDTKHDLDEIIRLSEKDVNLTEMFLRSSDRSSMNMNWNSAGALLSYIGDCVDVDDSSAKPDSVTSGGTRGLHFVHPPVPRSVHVPSISQTGASATAHNISEQASASGSTDSFSVGNHQTPAQPYPYHRSLPLPIPKRLSPETTTQESAETDSSTGQSNGLRPADDAMTAALATAAAIACHRQSSASAPAASVGASTKAKKRPRKPHAKTSNKETANGNTSQALPGSPSRYRTAAISSASIMEATKQRSQFGFGGNHVVPSVPLPPPQRKQQHQPKVPPAPPPPSTNIPEDAYERKKQRAKESRVKLNESIERTAIAISLSGTQSRQRAAQLHTIRVTCPRLRKNTLHALEDCARISGEAKKWDRPSFVGTAASLIQALNAQCEALMNEILELKKQDGEASVAALAMSLNEAASQSTNMATSRVSPSFNGDVNMQNTVASDETVQNPKRKGMPEIRGASMGLYSGAKRPRLEESTPTNGTNTDYSFVVTPQTIDTMLSMTSSMKPIMTMLDPRSLVRCSKVSKSWKPVFQNEEVWLKLCIDRYGQFNVRQWKEKMEDEHLPPCSSINLYRNMDSANVKPYCKQEGSLFLGGARMPGKVSAWVSMVERSNGETIRSVVKESEPRSYTSLPVVELRLLIQNIGSAEYPIVLKEQAITVDASTRRRGEEMEEIQWDSRLKKVLLNLDGSPRAPVDRRNSNDIVGELCDLKLFEAVILVVQIHARGCSTTSKFQQKSNFTKVLVTLNGTTVPLVIPFFRESSLP